MHNKSGEVMVFIARKYIDVKIYMAGVSMNLFLMAGSSF